MDLAELKKEIPYKWRVQSFSTRKPQAVCVAYLDSRLVQDLLDDVVGPENWQDKYEEHKGNLFCSIGINTESGWVWKTDCGTESNQDKEKGEASDAFKRAAVKWGIGRFLYAKKVEYLPANETKTKNPVNWPYVVDQNGRQVWNLTEHINRIQGNQKQPPPKPAEPEDIAGIRELITPLFNQKLLTKEETDGLKLAASVQDWPTYRQIAEDITERFEQEPAA